jgi:hypothetical protein
MKITNYQGEKSLTELATRLYKIRGARAEARMREAEAALLRANPHLHDLSSLPEGAVILVPELRGVKTAELGLAAANLPGEIVQTARQVLSALQGATGSSLTLQETEADRTLELLKSRGLRAAAARDPAVKARLEGALQAVQADQKEARASRDLLKASFTEISEGLNQVLRRLE